jgi:hypothetical protein
MHPSFFTYTLALSFVLFWKLMIFEFLVGISETFLCPIFALLVKTILLLDVLQLLMLLVGTFICLKPKVYL